MRTIRIPPMAVKVCYGGGNRNSLALALDGKAAPCKTQEPISMFQSRADIVFPEAENEIIGERSNAEERSMDKGDGTAPHHD